MVANIRVRMHVCVASACEQERTFALPGSTRYDLTVRSFSMSYFSSGIQLVHVWCAFECVSAHDLLVNACVYMRRLARMGVHVCAFGCVLCICVYTWHSRRGSIPCLAAAPPPPPPHRRLASCSHRLLYIWWAQMRRQWYCRSHMTRSRV
jgi:hypothetical protein